MKARKSLIGLMIAGLAVLGTVPTVQAQNMTAPQVSAADNVSEKELKEFAMVYKYMQTQNQTAQQEMVGIIKESGLEVQRFNEIQKAKMDENKEVDATEKELASHGAATSELKKLQPKLEAQMQKVIEESSLTADRYQAIGMALQQDKTLQQRFQQVISAMQTEG